MNQAIKTLILLLFSVTVSISIYAEENGGILKINVRGIKGSTGVISVGLYNKEGAFPDSEKIFQGQKVAVIGKEILVTFSNLPQGEYAVAVFHDENTNGKLDKNFLGIPKEAYGFSNDAHGVFGPPPFKDAKVTLKENSTLEIVINIK